MRTLFIPLLLTILSFFSIINTQAQSGWNELGTGPQALNANAWIRRVQADAAGNIYAIGEFKNASGNYYVAKWDGSSWQQLGNLSVPRPIYSLACDAAGNVYAAGDFLNSNFKQYVAKWNGSSWEEVGTLNATSFIYKITFDHLGNLYAAGSFTNLSGKPYVAKWDGTSWQETGTLNVSQFSSIDDVEADRQGNLYCIGSFKNASGLYYVAKWNGSVWQELGTGTNSLNATSRIGDIICDTSGKVYAAGGFSAVPHGIWRIGMWDGTAWKPLGTGPAGTTSNNGIGCLFIDNENALYAAGGFTDASGKTYVAKWLSSTWVPVGSGSNSLAGNAAISGLCKDITGNIYVGGSFTNPSGKFYVAKYGLQQPAIVASFLPYFAGSGATVNIKGDYFTGATGVSFNGALSSSFQVLSDSMISAVVPVSTSGNISIINNYGSGASPKVFESRPVIDSFFPLSGKMNEQVLIRGFGFNSNPLENVVRFGEAKAVVLSSSDTSLVVLVPAAAIHAPISVTNNDRRGSSILRFRPVFDGGALVDKSYRYTRRFYGDGIRELTHADFNNDGLPDVVVGVDSIRILKNTSSQGIVSLSLGKGIVPISTYANRMAMSDFDSDGQIDIIWNTSTPDFTSQYSLSVLINNNTQPEMSFTETRISSPQFSHLVVADMDNDGRPDIIGKRFNSQEFYVYRNSSTAGNISFEQFLMINTSSSTASLKFHVADLNADGKLDISYASGSANNFFILKNTSIPGTLSFDLPLLFPSLNYPNGSEMADLDNDGKLDIIIKQGNVFTFTIWRNTSTASNFSFSSSTIPSFGYNENFRLADVDGDGKIDLVRFSNVSNHILFYKNTGSPGNISFGNPVKNLVEFNDGDMDIVDMNGDGKPDINIVVDGKLSVFRNALREPVVYSFEPRTANPGDVITIKGSIFTGASSVQFDNAVSSFTVVSDSVIQATLGGTLSGKVTVTNQDGVGTLTGWFPIPYIDSIQPSIAKIRDTVTIYGGNFRSNLAANTVRFGHIKASVVEAGDSMIKVLVPKGIAFEKLFVVANGYTAISNQYFSLQFADGHSDFRANSFAAPVTYTGGDSYTSLILQDKNEDGKPDIGMGGSYTLYKNASDSANLLMLELAGGDQSYQPNASFDMNGDGKEDQLLSSSTGLDISKNISTPANDMFFDWRVSYSYQTTSQTSSFDGLPAIADLDKDGNPDIITSFANLNKSGEGLFKMVPFEYKTSTTAAKAYVADFDNDGQQDIFTSAMRIFRNTSTNGIPSFASPVVLPSMSMNFGAIADLDADGKLDLIVATSSARLAVLRNTSTLGTISFAAVIYIPVMSNPQGIAIADFNGDGKPDIAATNQTNNSFSLIKNNSTQGNPSFSAQVRYPAGLYPTNIAAADFNMDGVPDIALYNIANTPALYIYINKQATASKVILCPSFDDAVISSDITGASYQWQVSTDSVNYTNLSNDVHYSGVDAVTLALTAIPSSWYGYRYRCIINGNNNSNVFTLQFANTWTGTVSNDWNDPANWSCGAVPDSNTDVIIPSGNIVVSTNTIIRSLTISNGGTVTVNPGVVLTITH